MAQVRRFRLWAFDITHGGGGPTVRAADEFRIQITNGPATLAGLRWRWRRRSSGRLFTVTRTSLSPMTAAGSSMDRAERQQTGARGSPSVQVKEADIQAGHDQGIHHLTKEADFGAADIVTMRAQRSACLSSQPLALLRGTMTAEQANADPPPYQGDRRRPLPESGVSL